MIRPVLTREQLDAIISGIERGRVAKELRATLVAIVESWARSYDARVQTISALRADRSVRIRRAVREAAERTMTERPGLDQRSAAGIVRKRAWAILKSSTPLDKKSPRCPCLRTVRSELRPYFQKTVTYGATSSRKQSYATSLTT